MDAIAKLLNELKTEYEQPQTKSVPPQPQLTQPVTSSTSSDDAIASDTARSAIAKMLIEVKADFAQQDLAQEPERQEQLEQERIQQAQLRAQKLELLRKQAEDWLEKLDQFSPEGLWFDRFAEKYSSKLEAAIDYLQSQ